MFVYEPDLSKYSRNLYDYRYDVKNTGIIYDKIKKEFIKIVYKGKPTEYPKVVLLGIDGVRYNLVLHRLLATYYISNPDNKPQVNHIDGDKSNFNLENLEWVTPSENTKKAYDNNQMELFKLSASLKTNRNKLSPDKAEELIDGIMNGLTNYELGIMFNIHPRYVSCVRGKSKWKSIWNKKYPNQTPPQSNKQMEFKITDNYYKFPITTQVEIIEKLRYHNNLYVSKEYGLDPSILSRVRTNKTWAEALNRHKDIYKIKIPLRPISINNLPIEYRSINNRLDVLDILLKEISLLYKENYYNDILILQKCNLLLGYWIIVFKKMDYLKPILNESYTKYFLEYFKV